MKQKKRVWMSFNLWEANVFEQYLEEMAAQGWFLESVGGSVMKFHRAEPAKRRYAALLVPGSSSLTGADSWKAEQFRKQCQEAGWNFECSGTFWQIFYTTDDAVERTGDMTEEKQFLIQKSLSWTWSVKLCYPVLIVLEAWGLKYANNEVCYPATLIVGDIIKALKSGKYDISKIAVAITQTGGQCRASNYISLIKKALVDAGYTDIPVISISVGSDIDNDHIASKSPTKLLFAITFSL